MLLQNKSYRALQYIFVWASQVCIFGSYHWTWAWSGVATLIQFNYSSQRVG